jgi:hypothetical protein
MSRQHLEPVGPDTVGGDSVLSRNLVANVHLVGGMSRYGSLAVLAIFAATAGAQTRPSDCSERSAQDFVPMTRTDRAALYIKDLAYPQAYLYSGALAGIEQWRDAPKEWSQGSLGYARRFGSDFAYGVISTTLENGLAVGLDEDSRYFRSGERGFGRRLGYAVSSAFLARHSNGARTLSLSRIGGVTGGAAIQQIWEPPSSFGARDAARTAGLTFAFHVGVDVFREFAPHALARLAQ